MSHPDHLYDPSDYLLAEYFYNLYNNKEDTDMYYHDDTIDPNYDDHEDFYSDSFDDDMDGDMESGLASAGWGTDEDYGYYGDDTPMSDDYYGGE